MHLLLVPIVLHRKVNGAEKRHERKCGDPRVLPERLHGSWKQSRPELCENPVSNPKPEWGTQTNGRLPPPASSLKRIRTTTPSPSPGELTCTERTRKYPTPTDSRIGLPWSRRCSALSPSLPAPSRLSSPPTTGSRLPYSRSKFPSPRT